METESIAPITTFFFFAHHFWQVATFIQQYQQSPMPLDNHMINPNANRKKILLTQLLKADTSWKGLEPCFHHHQETD